MADKILNGKLIESEMLIIGIDLCDGNWLLNNRTYFTKWIVDSGYTFD